MRFDSGKLQQRSAREESAPPRERERERDRERERERTVKRVFFLSPDFRTFVLLFLFFAKKRPDAFSREFLCLLQFVGFHSALYFLQARYLLLLLLLLLVLLLLPPLPPRELRVECRVARFLFFSFSAVVPRNVGEGGLRHFLPEPRRVQ